MHSHNDTHTHNMGAHMYANTHIHTINIMKATCTNVSCTHRHTCERICSHIQAHRKIYVHRHIVKHVYTCTYIDTRNLHSMVDTNFTAHMKLVLSLAGFGILDTCYKCLGPHVQLVETGRAERLVPIRIQQYSEPNTDYI